MWFLLLLYFCCYLQLSTGQLPETRFRRSSPPAQPRIIGGHPAESGEVPWNLQMLYKGEFVCSATLVQSVYSIYHFALTSADCLRNPDDNSLINDQVEVIAGVIDKTKEPEAGERVKVREVIRHPTYKAQDVAFLLLEKQLKETEDIFPMALPLRPDFYPDLNIRLTVAGWGSSKKGDNAHRNNHLQVKVYQGYALADCQYEYPSGHVLDTALCAWDEPTDGYEGVCKGDWGAGAISTDTQTEFRYIAGIFSWSVGKCGETRKPSIFVRVSSVVKWILEVDEKYRNEYNKNA